MTAARILLLGLPCFLVVLLAQAIAWVPSYHDQGALNPSRLEAFVEASIGDARLLNPILNADTSSSRIADLVFDGLLRVGEDLELEGALARNWTVTESAFLAAVDVADANAMARRIGDALRASDAGLLLGDPQVVAPMGREVTQVIEGRDAPVSVQVNVPARVRLNLSRVVPDLEQRLRDVLGVIELAPGLDPSARVDAGAVKVPEAMARQLIPSLEHNPEITFTLRQGVTFHDGHPFDASDVVFTWRAIMNARNLSPRRSSFEPVKEVRALDAHTVRVTYKRLFSPAVGVWTIGILPEHLLDDDAMRTEMDERKITGAARAAFAMRDSRFNRNPVGTGAFRFRSWSSDELIRLSRNPDYHAGPAVYAEYFYRVLPDSLTQELEFRTGAIDTYQAEPHQAERYRTDERYRAFSAITPAYTYIGYNLRRAPFADERVRRALGMAIDVDALIRYALFDEGERVTGPFASITRWYDRTVSPLPNDPAGASALLAEAGWARGADGWLEKDGKRFEFNLITNHGNLRRKAVATIVQQAWQRIGIKCNVQVFEWAVFLADFVNPGQFDAVVLGWRLDLDPDLYQLWHSSQTGPNQLNFVGFSDPRSDALMEALRLEYRPDIQQQLAHQLHRRIAALQPYTFLYAPRSTRLLDRKIVMRAPDGALQPVRAGGAGDLFFHMNRWQRLAHDPGF